ncbi:MAG: hypothetical protein KGK08_08180 [Acidobacteriota bacterium]|nr:hypothetical protein [Acidobacteriota bacterium]
MADQLYLSLWFPNFRFNALPGTMVTVLRQFAAISGEKRVAAATVYPISFAEAPTYQRIFVNDERAAESRDTEAAIIENAVAEATEQLHEDMAYEFEMRWKLWQQEPAGAGLDPLWKLVPATVRILGFGPEFDEASFDQNGHIRVDFGLDTPWVQDAIELPEDADAEAAELAQQRLQQNVEKLLAFTLSVEKHCGISGRLLWTESGEPLAEKLIAQLQRLT